MELDLGLILEFLSKISNSFPQISHGIRSCQNRDNSEVKVVECRPRDSGGSDRNNNHDDISDDNNNS